jgi:hypothetical protein
VSAFMGEGSAASHARGIGDDTDPMRGTAVSVIVQSARPPAASRISGESKSASAAVCSARVALPANSCR